MQKFIVAEVTKNWTIETPVDDLLCSRFEMVINTNFNRGYKLIDWKITSVRNDTVLTETVIAIFELQSKDIGSEGEKAKEEILSCPFCGGRLEWINLAHPSGIPALSCPECQFSMLFYWNRGIKIGSEITDEEIEKMAEEEYGNNKKLTTVSEWNGFIKGAKNLRDKLKIK